MAGNILGGVGSLSIDGVAYPVVADVNWSSDDQEWSSLSGMDAVHGAKVEIKPPFIEATIRDRADFSVANFRGDGRTVDLQLRSGKSVTGANMWTCGQFEVDAGEGTLKVRFEGPSGSVTEY